MSMFRPFRAAVSGLPAAPVAAAVAAALALMATPALAGSFTISADATTAQTLGSGSGQTGVVNTGASLTVSGSKVAVTISGNNATLNNQGSIIQTGSGRVVRDNTGVSGLMIVNGSVGNASALMQSADADVIQMNKSAASVSLDNYGTLESLNASQGGAQAVDFNAIQSGSNVVNNYATGIIRARDADAVRPGVNGVVNNYGQIVATTTGDSSSDGVDVQENSGVIVNNYAGGSISGARHGITGGAASSGDHFTTTVNNGGSIAGNNGSGINLDGFNAGQTATIVNSGTITGNGVSGDGDGIDVDGVAHITNSGSIRSLNAVGSGSPAQSEGITIGGGSVINSGTIEGLVAAGNGTALGRGITLAGVDSSGSPEPIYADSVITNLSGGVIRGQTDSAIVVGGGASGYTVTIDNNAGARIIGGSSSQAAIRTGADNDTLRNAGTIDGASSGKAVDLGAGNDSLYLSGGSVVVLGDLDGGSGSNLLHVDAGAGNSLAYGGSIANFDRVEIAGGTVSLSGNSSYSGTTRISGGTLVLTGGGRLSSDSSLELAGGTLEIADAAGSDGQDFAALALLADSTIDLDFSALSFASLDQVVTGAHLSIVDYLYDASLGYALRFLGDYSGSADFLALLAGTTINGGSAGYYYDGSYTGIVAAQAAAVPEPASVALLLQSLGLLGFVALKRKRG